MSSGLSSDDFVAQLPLPLAQLYRRAHNAKTPQDRHHHAFYLAEAALKLTACLRISAALSCGLSPEDPLAKTLEEICLPSIGHWVRFFREANEYLKQRPNRSPELNRLLENALNSGEFGAVRKFADCISAGESSAVSPETAREARGTGILGFFTLVAAYRNQVFGHGAQKLAAYYEEVGPLLLAAVREVLEQPCLFGDLMLVVGRIGPTAGPDQVEWQWLQGTASLLLPNPFAGATDAESIDAARDAAGKVFFIGSTLRVPLYPLAVYYEDHVGRERFGFLNRTIIRRKRAGGGELDEIRRCEYLDYATGDHLREVDTRVALTRFLARLRGVTVSESEFDRLLAAAVPDPEELHELVQGTVIGDFELSEELGRGAMGVIYRARQRSLNRWVALKVLPGSLGADPTSLARFRREVDALSRCEHPNLVKIVTAGSDGDRHFFAMELIEGLDLDRLCKRLRGVRTAERRRLQARDLRTDGESDGADRNRDFAVRVAELFYDAAGAIEHLHARGILHRDLKPSNVMLTGDGRRIVVMDLGLAQLQDDASLTQADARVGTLRYCPPEQVEPKTGVEPDGRADVYSLGATFYELATLAPIFAGEAGPRLMAQVLGEEPRNPQKIDSALPADLAAILQACLVKERAGRYANARDLGDDLRRFLQGEPVKARPVAWLGRAWRWTKRNPRMAGLSAALAVALVTIAAGATMAAVRIDVARREAETQRNRAEEQSRLLAQSTHEAQAAQQRAEEGELRAVEQTKLAEQRGAEILKERNQAEREKANAIHYFRFAREAVDHLYRQVSESKLLEAPGLQSIRLDLLTVTRRFYEEFVESQQARNDAAGELVSELDLGELLLRLADVTAHTKSNADAIPILEQAEKLFLDLAKKSPQDAEVREYLAGTYHMLTKAYTDGGQFDRARRTIAELTKLKGDDSLLQPDSLFLQIGAVASLYNEGIIAARAGNIEDARTKFEEAVKKYEALAQANSENGLIQWKLALTMNAVATLDGNDRPVRTARALKQVLSVYDRAATLTPELEQDGEFMSNRAVARGNLGQALVVGGDVGAAVPVLKQALAEERLVIELDPESLQPRLDLARVLRSLTYAYVQDDEIEEAEKVVAEGRAALGTLTREQQIERWEILLELSQMSFLTAAVWARRSDWTQTVTALDTAYADLQLILQTLPSQLQTRGMLKSVLLLRADAYNKLGRFTEALTDADELEELGGLGSKTVRLIALAGTGRYAEAVGEFPPDAGVDDDAHYVAACFHAVVAQQVSADDALEESARSRLSAVHMAQAMERLDVLRSKGYFLQTAHGKDLENNRCLAALRSLPDFKLLLDRVTSDR